MTRVSPGHEPHLDPPVEADPRVPAGLRGAGGRRGQGASRSPMLARWGLGVVGLLIGLGVWALLTSGLVTDDPVIGGMSPTATWSGFGDLLDRGVLLSDAGVSLYRLVAGLAVAAFLGIPLGLWLGLRRRVEAVAGPLVQFLRMISPLSWAPVAVAVFGIGNEPVIFLVAAAAV